MGNELLGQPLPQLHRPHLRAAWPHHSESRPLKAIHAVFRGAGLYIHTVYIYISVLLSLLNELQADPKLYASNVRQYMLEKQKVLETLGFI